MYFSQVMGPSVADEDMDRLREKMEELETHFQVEEEQEGEAQPLVDASYIVVCKDNSQLRYNCLVLLITLAITPSSPRR